MTQQAERTRNVKYVLAESSRWLLHRRRDTKKIDIPGCRKKIRKERKEQRKTKSRKQGTKASKQENRTQGVSIATNFPSLLQSRDGHLATPSAIFFLLSSATVSSVTAAAVEPSPPANKSTKTKQNCLDSGTVATQVPLIS